MESLQTESVSILSLLCFLLHFSSFHNLTLTPNAWIQYCDNSTAVKRMKWFNLQTVLKPSLTLAADFDVQLQIEATLAELHTQWNTEHVKGHQSGPNLSWEAQLNNRADELATEARNALSPTAATKTIIFPAAQISFTISNHLITRRIDRAIHEAYTQPMIRKNMQTRFGWKNTVVKTIDWQIHGSNLVRLGFYKHRFIVKLIHERLPVLGESFNPSPSKVCPCCKTTDESIFHFHKCTANPEPWINAIPHLTSAYQRNNIDPVLRILINASLTKTPTLSSLQRTHPHVNFRPYKRLLRQQTAIGWSQLRYGRWSNLWKPLQSHYYKTTTPRTAKTHDYWQNTIIQCLWNHAHLRWNARNSLLHDCNNVYDATKENLMARITAAYSHQPKLLPQDHTPFKRSLDEWRTMPVSTMKMWLLRELPYIHHCLKVAQTQATNNTNDIRTFFVGSPCTHQSSPQPQRRLKRRVRRPPQLHQNIHRYVTKKKRPSIPNAHITAPKKPRPHKLQDKPPDSQTSLHQLNLFETLFTHTL